MRKASDSAQLSWTALSGRSGAPFARNPVLTRPDRPDAVRGRNASECRTDGGRVGRPQEEHLQPDAGRARRLPGSHFADAITPDGQPNPLLKGTVQVPNPQPDWPTETSRSPQPPDSLLLPTSDDVQSCLGIPFFDSDPTGFSETFAGFHDNIHNWVGGEMGQVPWASYDPIFWSHHCMVDRVWYLWQIQPSNANFVWDPQQLGTALSVPEPLSRWPISWTLPSSATGMPLRKSSPPPRRADS